MDKAPRLRIIALTAVGFDSVDLLAATERGIIVTNTAGSLTDTVADLVFALILAADHVVVAHLHLEASGPFRHSRPDPAEPHDPQRCPGQVRPQHEVRSPGLPAP